MSKKSDTSCAENGIYTPLPAAAPSNTVLDFNTIDPVGNQSIVSSGAMSFSMVGCSGDPATQTNTLAVAEAMIQAGPGSFFYHLGDLTYTPDESGSGSSADTATNNDEPPLWNSQFYAPYSKYPKTIFSIAGNHDGKASSTPAQSQIANYFANFCANSNQWPTPWTQNSTDQRPAVIQPYPYWTLVTPLAYIVGLYTNVVNGGMLDDPSQYPRFTDGPQYQWLVAQLQSIAAQNRKAAQKRAVLLALHYPPYSGAANFNVRGDQSRGKSKGSGNAPYLAVAIQQAFTDAGQRPDVIYSAHAHLFQRLSYTFADGTVMPCIVAGCGGHSPLEVLSEPCAGGKPGTEPSCPFPAVLPGKFQFPAGESAVVNFYQDGQKGGRFGFAQTTIQARTLNFQFIDTAGNVADSFTLDLDAHQLHSTAQA